MQSRDGPGPCLVSVENEERDHEGEQAGSFGEGKAKNGIREKLTCAVQKVVSSLHTCLRVRVPQGGLTVVDAYFSWPGCGRHLE
jgi:hypothetical protein